MVEIINILDQDMKAAMKEKDKFTLSVIRMLRSEIKYAEIAAGSSLNEEQVIDVLSREAKKRRDAAADYVKAGRAETAKNLEQEVAIISRYLPEPLSETELTELVSAAITETGASTPADIGKVMGIVMPQVKGRADGKQVSAFARKLISK
ncbi:MAG: GatB/YqeY domain-containing protein [Firmicutes bacterium]|nr:GatB/YqeY domain-containing protein [Bacillota bacterium]